MWMGRPNSPYCLSETLRLLIDGRFRTSSACLPKISDDVELRIVAYDNNRPH